MLSDLECQPEHPNVIYEDNQSSICNVIMFHLETCSLF